MYFLIVVTAIREIYALAFVRVPVTTHEFVFSLKALDTFFFVIKKFNQLFTKFSITPEKEIIIKYNFFYIFLEVRRKFWNHTYLTFSFILTMTIIASFINDKL